MKFVTFKHLAVINALLLSSSLPHAVFAVANGAATVVPVSTDEADGEIRKIDKDAMKLTIKHGEIKSLDMPAMTMVFRVKEVAMFDTLKSGDKIKFKANRENGSLTVTEIHIVK